MTRNESRRKKDLIWSGDCFDKRRFSKMGFGNFFLVSIVAVSIVRTLGVSQKTISRFSLRPSDVRCTIWCTQSPWFSKEMRSEFGRERKTCGAFTFPWMIFPVVLLFWKHRGDLSACNLYLMNANFAYLHIGCRIFADQRRIPQSSNYYMILQ